MVEFVITYSGTFGPDQGIHERQVYLNSDCQDCASFGGVCVYVCTYCMYVFLFILITED